MSTITACPAEKVSRGWPSRVYAASLSPGSARSVVRSSFTSSSISVTGGGLGVFDSDSGSSVSVSVSSVPRIMPRSSASWSWVVGWVALESGFVVVCSVFVVGVLVGPAVFTRSIIRASMIKSMRKISMSKERSRRTGTGAWPMKSMNRPPWR